MNFFQTLMHPDRQDPEEADRTLLVSAANLLEVGEFQFLQLAYHEWFGRDLPPAQIDGLFHSYMMHSKVPHWARHYARLILTRAEGGLLNPADRSYHRYDHEFRTYVPRGLQRFLALSSLLVFCMVTLILIADYTVKSPMTRLPPYFDREEFRLGDRNRADGRVEPPSGWERERERR